ncbi:hypothetical protein [Hyalangium sp.]|uniref:hypothetical protein n=1 Tax=Hyalangium sp. TaxID=2028555 RepID=UPI002D34C3F5|nr:hypothetical protein [Hyalangium sp.]HYH96720.1 hypothetical protein [Hyalangium sp.]
MTLTWVVVLLLTQAPGAGESADGAWLPASAAKVVPPADAPPTEAREAGRWNSLIRLEASTLALLPRGGAGEHVGYTQLSPALVVDDGAEWGLHVGAAVRVRLWGGETRAGRVRTEDWDSLSDWGQVVRALKLGSDASRVGLWVGELEDYSLVSGHLVRRYSNRAHPDYHPAGASLTARLAPLYVEAFTSDVLGARLTGAQADVDVEHLLGGAPREPGRYMVGLSVVRDWGRAEGVSPQVTLVHVDGTAVVVVRPGFELHVLGGWGERVREAGAWGAVVGVGADVVRHTLDMKVRLEARAQRGGFRQGYFGPDYELSRWRAVGSSGLPVAQAPFPEGFSAYGEAVVGWDGVRLGGLLQRHLHLSLGVEVFDWGRVDVDGRWAVQLAERSLEVAVSGLALGLGQPGARQVYAGQVRWRFAGRLYALGQIGTLLSPTAQGELRSGAFAAFGLGVDNAR